MLIAAMSDTHQQQFSRQCQPDYCFTAQEDKQDVLIHAGDFTVTGSMGQIHAFADWVRGVARHFKAVIFIAGNHDYGLYSHQTEALEYFKDITNCYYLENSGVTIDGVKFWGSPMTPEYRSVNNLLRRRGADGWAFGRPKERLIDSWKLIPKDTDVLITHTPPYGIGDQHGEHNFGSESLLATIKEIQPKLHVFGHIHSGTGTYTVGKTMCLNAAMLDDNYKMQRVAPHYIHLP